MKNTVYIIIDGDRSIRYNKVFWRLSDAEAQLELERYMNSSAYEWYITEVEVV